MCTGSGPPYGIPIEAETHKKYSRELKKAWRTFDNWWKKAAKQAYPHPVSKSTMPDAVRKAMQLILDTPIPGLEGAGYTGKDSCYMVSVLGMMTD